MKLSVVGIVVGMLIGLQTMAGGDGLIRYRITAVKMGDSLVTSTSNIVEVRPTMNIWVPNAFTPNNDGLNDDFGARAEGVFTFSMQIYNRWGELIFASNDINQRWDGTYKGNVVPSGTYSYQLFAESSGEVKVYKNGSVTVVK